MYFATSFFLMLSSIQMVNPICTFVIYSKVTHVCKTPPTGISVKCTIHISHAKGPHLTVSFKRQINS